MRRRHLLHAVSAAVILRAPNVRAQSARARTLRFVPQADLAVLDPIVTSAYVTRNHALLVYDTLYGLDAALRPLPQMVGGHLGEKEGRRWTFRLREGLAFHDGERVRARDCVASIRRWWRRDPLGQLLAMRTEDISAIEDRTFTIRLARPFGPMLDALDKLASPICASMPERLANTDPWQSLPRPRVPAPSVFAPTRECRVRESSTTDSSATDRVRAAGPNGRRVRSSPGSTVSSGTSCRIPLPSLPPCSAGKSTGGSSLPSTCSHCCVAGTICPS